MCTFSIVSRLSPIQELDINANHAGAHEFRLCCRDGGSSCDSYEDFGAPLENADADPSDQYGRYTFHVQRSDLGNPKKYYPRFRLPQDFTCNSAVMQWWWITANVSLLRVGEG